MTITDVQPTAVRSLRFDPHDAACLSDPYPLLRTLRHVPLRTNP